VVALGGAGCSAGDDCNTAAAHLAECLQPAGDPAMTDKGPPAKCENATLCRADCVNRTECQGLLDLWEGRTSASASAYSACIDACAAP